MKNLISKLITRGALQSKNVTDAFLHVDRKDFIISEYKNEAYENIALPIGFGQTISQPATVAFMLEKLSPRKGEKILDVGSGSGWTTALLAHIVGEKGKVFGVEIIPELVKFGQNNLAKYDFPQARILQAGKEIGLPKEAPFDRILVSASGTEISGRLINQLKSERILVMPIKYSIYRIKKMSNDKLDIQEFPGFVFVPLKNQFE